MKENIDFSTIVRDYINGHINEDAHDCLIQYFYQQEENKPDELYELIADQIDSLSPDELNAFHSKLKQDFSKNHPSDVIQINKKNIKKWRLLAAASIIALCSIGVYFLSDYLPFFNGAVENQLKLTEVTTDNNETRLVHLPDGSEVNLNSASTLRYSTEPNTKERIVYLDGEAFFKIEPNKKRPFIVHALDNIYTKVLGTSFNVRTYKDLKEIKVRVQTGKVEVGSQNKDEDREVFGTVSPNQEFVYERKDEIYTIQKAEDFSSWMDGELVFIKNSLDEVLSEINRRYDIHIVLDHSVPSDLKCTATFSKDQSPLDIISALCKLHNLKYEQQSNTIILQLN